MSDSENKDRPNVDVSNYRDTSDVYDEVRQTFLEFSRKRSPMTVWQKSNIKMGRVKSIDKKDNNITILGIDDNKLNFSSKEPLFFYNEEHGVFGKSDVVKIDHDKNTVAINFPAAGKVKLSENRKSGRIETLDRYISIALKKERYPTPVSSLYLVNISPGGMAVRVTSESSNIFRAGENVGWVKFTGGSFKKPLEVTICHVSTSVHLPNLGDNNTVIGIQFKNMIPNNDYVKLLEKLFKEKDG